MKKVAHLANYDRGITIFLMPQLKALQQAGYEVHAIFPFGDELEAVKKENIIPHHISISRDISFLSDLLLFFRLINIFRKQRFHLIHAHTAKLEFFGQLAAYLCRVPIIVYTNHGIIFRSKMGSIKRTLLKWMAWFSGRLSSLIFSQSSEDIEYLIKNKVYPKHKLIYLGNGIDLHRFNANVLSKNEIAAKKKTLKIPDEHLTIGIVGRFVLEKGYKEFLLATAGLIKEYGHISILCIGNHTKNERDPVDFDRLIPSEFKTSYHILHSRDDMNELYAVMDIMVLPSHREGFPRALMEGAASGKPLVASNISGCREVIDDGKNGILFEVNNTKALKASLKTLIDNPHLRNKMGKEGERKAFKEFDQKHVVSRMLKGLKSTGLDV